MIRLLKYYQDRLTMEYNTRKPSESEKTGQFWLYPSSTAIGTKDQYGGACLRAMYYKMKKVEERPLLFRSASIFDRGKYVETAIQSVFTRCKDVEVLGTNVKFRDEINRVSGEFDLIVRVSGICIGVEIKTIGGNHYAVANQVVKFDSKPKLNYVLQVMRYLDFTDKRRLKLITGVEAVERGITTEDSKGLWAVEAGSEEDAFLISRFHIIYWASGEQYSEYALELQPNSKDDQYIIITKLNEDEKNYTYKFKELSLGSIHEQDKILKQHVEANALPDRCYIPEFPHRKELLEKRKEVIRKLNGIKRRKAYENSEDAEHTSTLELYNQANEQLTNITEELDTMYTAWMQQSLDFEKASYKKWEEMDRDWQCAYCSFLTQCLNSFNPKECHNADNKEG